MNKKDAAKQFVKKNALKVCKSYEQYQVPVSIQTNATPVELVMETVEKLNGLDGKDVLVVANYDVAVNIALYKHINTLQNLGNDYNFKSLTLLTDVAEHDPVLGSKFEVVLANLNEPAKIDMMGKKFDVVIGNPPYQPDRGANDADYPLWLDFVDLGVECLTAEGKLVFITPPKFIGQKRPVSSRSKVDYSVFLNNKVNWVKVLTQKESAKYFNGVGSKFAIYSISKGESETTPVTIGDKTFNIDLENTVPAPNNIDDLTAKLFQQLSGMEKFTFADDYSCHSQKYKKGNWSETPTDVCTVPIVVSHKITRYTDFKQELFDKPKILVPAVSTIDNACFSQNSNFGEDMKYLEVSSEEEANNILSILTSKLYRFIGDNFRPGRNLDKVARNVFPKLDTSRVWTDEEIYKAFDLSEEEINIVEGK
jgi:hypothetical protein